MKTQKNYRSQLHDGDSCKVNTERSYEEHLIEDHPQKLIEDHPRKLIEDHPRHLTEDHHAEAAPAAAAAAFVGAPIEGASRSKWWAWCVAGLVGLFIVGLGLYFGLRNDRGDANGEKYAYAQSGGVKAGAYGKAAADSEGVWTTSAAGSAEDYVYYFGNDKSAVAGNERLDEVADKIAETGADVVVTAYASQAGNENYNRKLSEKRADNMAGYLTAHGVPADHIKVVSSGETTDYGDDAHNRRANIHVVYPG